jgi:hypothetical protein
MINRRGLAGMGIWHLLMDEGVSDLWNVIANKFQHDTLPPSGGIGLLPSLTDGYAIPVRWRAIDVGAGLASYTVQFRDRATSTWTTWKAAVTSTSATFIGTQGHAYEFRVAARDKLGNTQPWQAAQPDPGTSLKVGGFATVSSSMLNVRSGAGTTFTQLDQLTSGERLALLSGPVTAGGYKWYQVQFDFAEWPSATYPRIGWVAAGDGTSAYIVPGRAPNVTTLRSWFTAYGSPSRSFSPNGDGRFDTVAATYTLPAATTAVRLDVLNSAGSVVDTTALGAQTAGAHRAIWDGRIASGAYASAGSYLLRITAAAAGANHSAPSAGVDAALLARWGVRIDLTGPTVRATSPQGQSVPVFVPITATFGEPVTGVGQSSFLATDVSIGAAVAGSVTYNPTTRVATFDPSASLAYSHTIKVALTSSIRDAVGNPMAPRSWTFVVQSTLLTYYSPPRSLTFAAGTHTGYRFDSSGRLLSTKSGTLSRASVAPTTLRSKAIPGHPGAWFWVTSGMWSGYWLPESTRSYLRGISEQTVFSASRTVAFAKGTYKGYRFNANWLIGSTLVATLSQSSSASSDRTAVINGRRYLRIINGIWAGYWVPNGNGVTLR